MFTILFIVVIAAAGWYVYDRKRKAAKAAKAAPKATVPGPGRKVPGVAVDIR